jgi:hypothetical protein
MTIAKSSDALERIYLGAEARLSSARKVRLGRLAYGLFEAAWLGIFDGEHLNAVTQAFYARTQHRYFDADYNTSGLRDWEGVAVERFFKSCGSVIVTAAGGGREVLALARRGLHVTAFECSPALALAGNAFLAEQGVAATIVLAPPDEVPNLQTHDGIVVGWGSYMHIAGRAARIAFLRRLRERVVAGGPLLLSFQTRPERAREREAVAGFANVLRRIARHRQPVEIGDELKGWYRHVFTRAEVEAELRAGGFEPAFFSQEGYGHAVGLAI